MVLGGCFHMKAPKSCLIERFSADTFKEERMIDIFPIRFKFIKQAATFSTLPEIFNNYHYTKNEVSH